MLAVFGMMALVREAALDSVHARLGEVGVEIAFVSLTCLTIFLFLTGMWLGYRRGALDPRLHCPHCNTMLFERRNIVVATRNCVRCGKRVLAEPE